MPLMMIGMAMKKNGFITGQWNARRLCTMGKKAGAGWLAVDRFAGGCGWPLSAMTDITSLAVFLAWSAIPRLMLTVGYAALLIMLVERLWRRPFIARVAATGQAAFTNYLGTSIIMTTIFYGYGLGLYGDVSRVGLWAFVIGAWLVMLLWSKPWLAHFRYGPLEWLWRSLARMKMQPLRR